MTFLINLKNKKAYIIIYFFLIILSLFYLAIKNNGLIKNLKIFLSNDHLDTLGTDKIFVINLKNRKDRHDTMVKLANFLNLNITFFDAINSEDVKKDTVYNNKPNHMKDGQLGCWISHMKIYEEIINDPSINMATILEDDIDIHIDIIKKTKIAIDSIYNKDWDILFLGHCSKSEGNPENIIDINAQLYKAQYPSCTHGYIITKKGAFKMLEYRNKPNYIDWQIGDLGLENYLNIYILSPPIILQYHSKTDYSDVNPDGNIYDPVLDIFSLKEFSTMQYIDPLTKI